MITTTHTITTRHFPALTYRRIGVGPALMLLHGFPASGSLWDGVTAALSSKYMLLIPDLPGSGNSRLAGEAVSMAELATVVPAILNDAGIAHCVLAGHSMGGYIAMAAASLFPNQLKGLLLVHSTAQADDEVKKGKREKSIALIRKGGREEFIKGMIPALFSETSKRERPGQVKLLLEEGLKLSNESAIAFYTAMMTRQSRIHALADIQVPIGWILGADDTTIPWQTTLQQTSIPRVSFVRVYMHCGHMSMIEQPDALAADIQLFSNYCAGKTEAMLR